MASGTSGLTSASPGRSPESHTQAEDMHISEDNAMNIVHAGVASTPTWLALVTEQSGTGVLWGMVFSFVLLIAGKLIDLAIKLLLEKIKEDKIKRAEGKEERH